MGKKKKRIKRLKKQEQGLLRQAKKHRIKAETMHGRKDTTRDYWLGEADRFEKRAKQRIDLANKIKPKEENNKEEDKKEEKSESENKDKDTSEDAIEDTEEEDVDEDEEI